MNLVEFLEARIAEDEAEAKNLQGETDFGLEAAGDRMLAECAAKRAIIGHWGPHESLDGPNLLSVLATVYKDHPDYREDWPPAT